jgi:hypothetical protein
VLDTIQRTADIAPAYDFFRSQEAAFKQTNDATAAFGRGDYLFGGAHALSGRYQYSRNTAENATALGASLDSFTNRALTGNGTERDTVRAVGGQLTSALSPTLLNDLRVQHSYESRRRAPNSLAPLIDAGSIGRLGTSPLLPAQFHDRRLQFVDSISLLQNGHSLKFGVDYSYISFYQWYGDNQTGSFIISNPDVASTLRTLSGNGNGGNRFDDPSVVYRRQVGVLATSNTAHQLAFLAQDTWRILPSLTLNMGLRWEGQLNPFLTLDNDFLMTNVRNFRFPLGSVDPAATPSNFNQWGPRFGITWSPGSGRTVLRAHTGLFYAQTPFILFVSPLSSFSTAPSDLSIEIAPNAGGTVYQQFLKAGFDLNQGALGSLPIFTLPDIWMKVAGSPNPFAGANVVTTSSNARNPRSTGYNKSDDDSERAISGITYQNPFDFRREYNWSSLDARHVASGYFMYRGPWGVHVTSLFRYRSGLPIDATAGGDISELLSGSRGNRPLELPGQPFLRNSFRNRDFKTFDLRLLKSFAITEAARL